MTKKKKRASRSARKSKLEIRVTCEGADLVPIASLRNFQGGLKKLPNAQYQKLRREIERHGFSFPVFVWKDKQGRYQIIDGHQRVLTVKKMMKEGYHLPDNKIPVAWIEAKTIKEAQEKLVAATSQYGRYTTESVDEFFNLSRLELSEMKPLMDLPMADMDELGERRRRGDVDAKVARKSNIAKLEVLQKKWNVKKGDLWEIPSKTAKGEVHLVKCGNSTVLPDIAEIVPADLVVTDPPYDLDTDLVRLAVSHFAERAMLLVTAKQLGFFCRDGWEPKFTMSWVHKTPRSKASESMPVVYHGDIMACCKKSVRFGWKRPTRGFGTVIESEFQYDQGHDQGKPPKVYRQMMLGFREAKRVADPFLGAGGVLIAAELEGKACTGVELDPSYVALALDMASRHGLSPRRRR